MKNKGRRSPAFQSAINEVQLGRNRKGGDNLEGRAGRSVMPYREAVVEICNGSRREGVGRVDRRLGEGYRHRKPSGLSRISKPQFPWVQTAIVTLNLGHGWPKGAKGG